MRQQQKYFASLDEGVLETPAKESIFAEPTVSTATQEWECHLKDVKLQLTSNTELQQPSHTVVMEAAFFLLEVGVLVVPETGRINVKQARALLHIAAWLQLHLCRKWTEAGILSADPLIKKRYLRRFMRMLLAIMGPPGTGKTSVVKVADALIEHFMDEDVVVRCAPSNTAARLFKGDTVHSWWKLLSDKCKGRRTLRKPVLDKLRRRWANKEIQFIDEISMLAPQQLAQGDVRTKAAKRNYEEVMGGVASVASGDMLQLPPVNRPSLAESLDVHGKRRRLTEEEPADADAKELDRQAAADHRTGLHIWHQFRSVVTLTLNVRAPGPLGDLLSEMRAGPLSEASMEVVKSRLIGYHLVAGKACALPLGAPDPRLTRPPFSTKEVHFVVARHKLRACQSFQNAMKTARALDVPVFVMKALDVAKADEEHLFTEHLRNQLLDNPTLRDTQHTPGILPLFPGMRLILTSKDCVHLGLMHGCELLLEEILCAPAEILPQRFVAGAIHELEYLPTALLLRAVGAGWSLPADLLPALATGVDTKGLFLLHPKSTSLRVAVKDDTKINIRRTGFQMIPAAAGTAHAAQGESWDAVIGDLARPPRIDVQEFWLMIYVILSRATSLEGFLALRLPTMAELNARPPQYLIDEMDRLLQLEESTTTDLHRYLRDLPCRVPPTVLALFAPDAEDRESREVATMRKRKVFASAPLRKRLRKKTTEPCVPLLPPAGTSLLKTGTDTPADATSVVPATLAATSSSKAPASRKAGVRD